MSVSEKVIEILNKDEKYKKMNTLFINAAEKQGLKGKELEGAREVFMMMLIAKNEEAMSVMAKDAYEHFNQL